MGVCLCFCPVPAMGESGLSAWPVYPDLWIRCAADSDDDIFCAASCGCGLFCWHDRSNDPGIWDWHRAGSVVSYPALGLLSCGLELPGIYFGDFLRFLGGFGCGTGYMDPSIFFFHHTDMACMGFGYCVPTAFDSGRSGLNFIDLGEHCEPEQVAAYLQAAEDRNVLPIFYLELTGGLREERNYFPSSKAA